MRLKEDVPLTPEQHVPASLTLYAEYSYVDKRADAYTFDWFHDNQVLCYIIMWVLFIIFGF